MFDVWEAKNAEQDGQAGVEVQVIKESSADLLNYKRSQIAVANKLRKIVVRPNSNSVSAKM